MEKQTEAHSSPPAPGPATGLGPSHAFLWLGLVLFLLLLIAFLLPITPQDYWWYLPIGRTILETGSVPTVDTLSFTRAGQPIFYQSWLAALIFWITYKAGGLTLTFLLRGLVLALTYGMLWSLMRAWGAGTRLAALVTLLSGLAGSNNWSMRPQLLAYPLFVLTLLVIYSWLRGEKRYLWSLPLIGILWCNLHGSYVLFFFLITSALLLGKGDRRALLPWFLVSCATILANPRGLRLVQDIFEMLRSPSNQVFSAEWHPPVNAGWQMNLFFAWLLVSVPMGALSQRRLSLLEWSWFLLFGWMALSGTRYVIWFLFLLGLFTAGWLSSWAAGLLDRRSRPGSVALNISIGALLLLAPLAFLPGIRESWWTRAPLPYDPLTTPVQAATWLARHPELPGPLLSDYAFSSYLELALPSRRAWIDTRFSLYPPEQWRRFQTLAAGGPGWQSILDEDRINLVMLAFATEPRLIESMRLDPAWCEQYADESAVLFSRCIPIP